MLRPILVNPGLAVVGEKKLGEADGGLTEACPKNPPGFPEEPTEVKNGVGVPGEKNCCC